MLQHTWRMPASVLSGRAGRLVETKLGQKSGVRVGKSAQDTYCSNEEEPMQHVCALRGMGYSGKR